jgi:hypothetical protein
LVGRTTQQQQQNNQQRKYTTSGICPDENGITPILTGPNGCAGKGGSGRGYSMDEAQWSIENGGEKTPTSSTRGSISESKRVQGLKQNTRMLLAVILLFLLTEIPAALIFSVHVGTVALKFTFIINHYALLNKLLIVR